MASAEIKSMTKYFIKAFRDTLILLKYPPKKTNSVANFLFPLQCAVSYTF